MELFVVLVVAVVMMAAFAPKPVQPKATAFEDIDFPEAEEGSDKHAVFGQKWSKSWMVLTVGNYRTRMVKVKGGGKK